MYIIIHCSIIHNNENLELTIRSVIVKWLLVYQLSTVSFSYLKKKYVGQQHVNLFFKLT